VLGTEAAGAAETAGVAAGAASGDSAGGGGPARAVLPDLAAEREVWRVEASRGRLSAEDGGGGVFDLLFDWSEGSWRLARCLD
jgi:hypothetical protein